MSTIRVFLQRCESIEAVRPDLYEKVMVPRVKPEDERRDETHSAETAQTILEYLSRYHFASVEHAIFALLWETGMRLGGAYSLDADDIRPEEETIRLVHRPDEGTRLKNGTAGERPIAITTELAAILTDYLKHNRARSVVYDYGGPDTPGNDAKRRVPHDCPLLS